MVCNIPQNKKNGNSCRCLSATVGLGRSRSVFSRTLSCWCKIMIQNMLLTRRKEEKGDLKVMDFTPQSPDLNPIENLWNHLKREKAKQNPRSKENMWNILIQCWNNIEPAVLTKLVHSMPDRVKAVLKSKGGHTKNDVNLC